MCSLPLFGKLNASTEAARKQFLHLKSMAEFEKFERITLVIKALMETVQAIFLFILVEIIMSVKLSKELSKIWCSCRM